MAGRHLRVLALMSQLLTTVVVVSQSSARPERPSSSGYGLIQLARSQFCMYSAKSFFLERPLAALLDLAALFEARAEAAASAALGGTIASVAIVERTSSFWSVLL